MGHGHFSSVNRRFRWSAGCPIWPRSEPIWCSAYPRHHHSTCGKNGGGCWGGMLMVGPSVSGHRQPLWWRWAGIWSGWVVRAAASGSGSGAGQWLTSRWRRVCGTGVPRGPHPPRPPICRRRPRIFPYILIVMNDYHFCSNTPQKFHKKSIWKATVVMGVLGAIEAAPSVHPSSSLFAAIIASAIL